jgi:hypothetical protein
MLNTTKNLVKLRCYNERTKQPTGLIVDAELIEPQGAVDRIERAPNPNVKKRSVSEPASILFSLSFVNLAEFLRFNCYKFSIYGLDDAGLIIVGLVDLHMEYFELSNIFKCTAKLYVQSAPYRLSKISKRYAERTSSSFTEEYNDVKQSGATTSNVPAGAWVCVGKMGNRGVSSGAHWHLDWFANGAPEPPWGKQSDIRQNANSRRLPNCTSFRVSAKNSYSSDAEFLANSYALGDCPDLIITSSYGMRNGKPHRGHDLITNQYRYTWAQTGFKVSTGVKGYDTYVQSVDRIWAIGHMDLMSAVASGIKEPTLVARAMTFDRDLLQLDSFDNIMTPWDEVG